jgi:ribose transport system permease protein
MSDVAVPRLAGLDRRRWLAWVQDYGVYVAIVVLIVADTAARPGFLGMDNLATQLFAVTPTLIVSLGMALVIGTEGIDLSVGAVVALASALIPLYLGYGTVTACLVALVAGMVSGAVAGSMVAFSQVQPIIATLALMIGVRGLAVIFNGNQAKPVSAPLLDTLGIDRWAGIPVMAYLAAVVVAIVAFVVRRTTFGRQVVAVGDNRAASRLAGLPVRRTLLLVYVISGLLAALAGVLTVGFANEADPAGQGLQMELAAITAVVVGGTPLTGGRVRVLGTVAGAIFMQLVIATLQQHNVAQSYAQIVEAVIICLAVYVARERRTR